MDIESLLVLLARLSLIAVFAYMLRVFQKNYKKQKANGFTNQFLLGYAFMFLFLLGYQVIISVLTIIQSFSTFAINSLQIPFTQPSGMILNPFVNFIKNLYRPLFILGFMVMELLFAAQVYPLEKMLGWNRAIGTKLMLISTSSLILVFIPGITYTTFSAILIYVCMAGLLYGFLMNLGVNIRMAITSTGEIKRRSIFIVLGSFLFYLGFIWALQVNWSKFIWSGFGLQEDIIFGSIMIIISSFFYRSGMMGEISR